MPGHRLQPTLVQAVQDHIAAGENNSTIYRATGVTRKLVGKMRLSLGAWGTPYPPRTVRLGAPRALREAQRLRLKDYLVGRPGAYLVEMKDFLYDEFDTQVSLATLWRELKRMRWSRKIASKRAKEQSEPLRRVYLARMAQHHTADQIVALDESACNERTGDRKYGCSPVGERTTLTYSFKRSERWSVLPAVTINGYFNFLIFQGAITSEIMEDFLQFQVLPFCNPHPAPNSVIVLDNASVYWSARTRELCDEASVLLEFLPPYSPDYHPIEKSFKQLKSWIKRHVEEVEVFDKFESFIRYAVEQTCCDLDCRSWFKMCGYPL
jgi:transposase